LGHDLAAGKREKGRRISILAPRFLVHLSREGEEKKRKKNDGRNDGLIFIFIPCFFLSTAAKRGGEGRERR